MKVEKDFIMREIGGDYILVPTGETALEFGGIISTNEVGAFLWEQLQNEISEEELLKKLLEEFEIDEENAKKDLEEFLTQTRMFDLLVE